MTEKRKRKTKKYIKKINKTKKNKCIYTDEAIRIKKLIKQIKTENKMMKKQNDTVKNK